MGLGRDNGERKHSYWSQKSPNREGGFFMQVGGGSG